MWNEPSKDVAEPSTSSKATQDPHPAIVASVEPGSIGEEVGFEAGDKLVSINGEKPRDLIDYQFLTVEEELNLKVIGKNGNFFEVNIEKDNDESLGLSFTEALFDGIKKCNNFCSFCFIDQQPEGNRKTLYIKDDDYRMSFLYGSYLTLTNLNKNDWIRIEKQRLSPLFVSVHATDPATRIELLKNQKAGVLMEQIEWFSQRRLQFHAQVVICPGLNDGQILNKTLNDLFSYSKGEWPTVISTAVVPVGLTRFRPENDGLKPVDKNCALKIINQVEKLQKKYKSLIGSNFAWLSDEWYLIAGESLPKRDDYEDLPQEENGVGSIRSFLEAMDQATAKLPSKVSSPRHCSWVVGKLVESSLKPACFKLNQIDLFTINLFGLPSNYWGQDQVVTGLLTGQDLIEGLKGKDLGDKLLVPSVMLRNENNIFLDDMHINQVSKELGIAIDIVYGPSDFISKALGIEPKKI